MLSVARPPDFAEEVETEAVLEHSRNCYQKALQALEQRADARGVNSHFEVAVGHPAEQIIYYAEQRGVDLIVVGHQRKALFDRWLLGSIAKQVVIHASCSVLVAR